MHITSKTNYLFLLVSLIFILTSVGWADGKFFPPKTYQQFPEIPDQTAVIKFKDGVETLIVQSSMSAKEGQQFAWVLPLPTEPTKMEKATPGTLKTLFLNIQPQIIGAREIELTGNVLTFISFFILTILLIFFRFTLLEKFMIWIIISILMAIAYPGFLTARAVSTSLSSQSPDSVTILQMEQVGNYNVVVLKTKTSKDLFQWLEANQFNSLQTSSAPVIDDYIKDKWVFLCTKITRSETGILAPHPLKLTFPATKPVYPMRLTGLDGTKTTLHLFLIGSNAYKHPFLEILFASEFDKKDGHLFTYSYYIPINHPDLVSLFDNGDWITYLKGDLNSAQMKEDLYPQVEDQKKTPFRKVYYTPIAALKIMAQRCLLFYTIAFPIVGLIFLNKWKRAILILIVVILAGLLYGFVGYQRLPQIEHYKEVSTRRFRNGGELAAYYFLVNELEKQNIKTLKDTPKSRKLIKYLLKDTRNDLLGGYVQEEDSPGNYKFSSDKNGNLELMIYSISGEPDELYLF